MKIHATYVGINRHDDESIPELTGAVRDATALWALFSDTLPTIQATLLVDAEARVATIRHALATTLGDAQSDDIVIFSFSGHGTKNHRLVAYDTDCEELIATTIGMDELASLFKTCNARALIIVLDCCFSGGAPARVLENTPVPRDFESPLRLIEGRGRILIAASADNEPAYEQPGTGHGLLTKALIDVLSSGERDHITLASAMDEVAARTRTEAARIGVTQTPFFINQIEGGLTLPRLKRGGCFVKAFPEFESPEISGAIEELSAFGVPPTILERWKERFPLGLNTLQREAVNAFHVLTGQSIMVIAPTSSGKTLIGELAAVRAVATGQKAVFLLPYRALVNEKFDTFSSSYAAAGIRIARCTGDYSDQAGLIISGRYDLAVLTYEMFLNLSLGSPALLNQLGLVVIDEAQFVTDPGRGITVELLLTLLIQARERGVIPQLVVLSAVIGNVNSFDEWLGCRTLISTTRPVPLIEGVLDRSGTFEYADETGVSHIEAFLPRGAIRQRKEKPSSQDVIVPLVTKLVSAGEKVIVFRNQRGTAEGCALSLADTLGLPAATLALQSLPSQDASSTSQRLHDCLGGGTAFHNTNLQRVERYVVEKFFRDPSGGIAVLGSTTTLAAGINTPASTVILAETEFVGDDGRPFTIAEYKNMVGRAGRLGYNEKGKAILLAEGEMQRRELYRKYVLGQPEPITSSFSEQNIATWMLRLLSQVKRIREDQAVVLLLNTYGGFLRSKRSTGWKDGVADTLRNLLHRMVSLGLAEREGEFLQLTLLGKACGRSSLSFDSALRLVDLLRQRDLRQVRAYDLLAIVQVLQESDQVFTPLMKRGNSENARVTDVSSRYGSDIARLLQKFAQDQLAYWARCKRASIIWDWIHGVPVDEIERRYTANVYQGRIVYGNIVGFAENARFHLRSAHQIISVLLVDDRVLLDALDALLLQLESGCPADSLGLLDLPLEMTRGQRLALAAAGAKTVEQVWALESQMLNSLIGESTTIALDAFRPKSVPL